jgi:hypothetical protein
MKTKRRKFTDDRAVCTNLVRTSAGHYKPSRAIEHATEDLGFRFQKKDLGFLFC